MKKNSQRRDFFIYENAFCTIANAIMNAEAEGREALFEVMVGVASAFVAFYKDCDLADCGLTNCGELSWHSKTIADTILNAANSRLKWKAGRAEDQRRRRDKDGTGDEPPFPDPLEKEIGGLTLQKALIGVKRSPCQTLALLAGEEESGAKSWETILNGIPWNLCQNGETQTSLIQRVVCELFRSPYKIGNVGAWLNETIRAIAAQNIKGGYENPAF